MSGFEARRDQAALAPRAVWLGLTGHDSPQKCRLTSGLPRVTERPSGFRIGSDRAPIRGFRYHRNNLPDAELLLWATLAADWSVARHGTRLTLAQPCGAVSREETAEIDRHMTVSPARTHHEPS